MNLGGIFQFSPEAKEVLNTFHVAAELGSDTLGAYVISMASNVRIKDFINLTIKECSNSYGGCTAGK